jgi:2-polyprenyl-3-methyl-5-hydroxy-6-metoxy-1,4-benzoquinol methylase
MSRSEKIESYIIPFVQQLKSVDADLAGMDNYCKTYLFHLLQHSRYYTQIYAHVLTILLTYCAKDKESIILVDYGAGNGLLGIFAKFCGFKKVYINDINENFTKAAAQFAEKLGITPDGCITGNMDVLTNYFRNKEKPDAITGTDVIEHVYSLHNMFRDLKSLNENVVTVFTTAANTNNWFKVRAIKKQQLFDEYTGGAMPENTLSGSEHSPAFFNTRQAIIQAASPDLKEEEIILLAKVTRGMIKDDILTVAARYHTHNNMPAPPSHPSNTCDPLSGSWAERLLTIDEYKHIYKCAGFELKQYNGFYNSYDHTIKSWLLKPANWLVKMCGKNFAPFITLAGFKK